MFEFNVGAIFIKQVIEQLLLDEIPQSIGINVVLLHFNNVVNLSKYKYVILLCIKQLLCSEMSYGV